MNQLQLASNKGERRLAVAGLEQFPAPIARARERAAFRCSTFEGIWVHLRYDPVTRSPSMRWLCQ